MWGCVCTIHSGESVRSVSPDGFCELVAVGLPCGELIIRNAWPIAEQPLWSDVIASPIRNELGQHMQGVMERFSHHFQAVELTDCRDDMGRIRALFPPRLEEPPLDTVGQ